MEERFFFDRIDMEGDSAAKDKGIENPFAVLPHPAEPPLPGQDEAAVMTQEAPHLSPLQRGMEHGLFNLLFWGLGHLYFQ